MPRKFLNTSTFFVLVASGIDGRLYQACLVSADLSLSAL